MLRQLLAYVICLSLLVVGGCAVCASPHDCKFAAYGGIRERQDMAQGRVGSVFDPAPEVSHVDRGEQSPQPVNLDYDAPQFWDEEDLDDQTDSDSAQDSDDSETELPPQDGSGLPELKEDGSIELPELEGESGSGDADAGNLLETGTYRGARVNPLSDLFEDEL